MALDVYSDEYKIVGKIDLYDEISKTLIERKKFVKKIYDGYIFQLYGVINLNDMIKIAESVKLLTTQ